MNLVVNYRTRKGTYDGIEVGLINTNIEDALPEIIALVIDNQKLIREAFEITEAFITEGE